MENRIKVLRTINDLTQEDLGLKVGCTRQTINSIEKNKYNPSLLLGFKIAEVFNVDINEVFHYQKNKD